MDSTIFVHYTCYYCIQSMACTVHVHLRIFICWIFCMNFFQEIEPSIGERLCRLWSTVSEDSSDAPREKRKGMTHSRKDGGIPTYPHHMTPMIHPHYPPMPIFHDGRHPHQIHLNPALYPMPRLDSYYFWNRPPRPSYSQGPSKRYSAQHRARSRASPTAKDSQSPAYQLGKLFCKSRHFQLYDKRTLILKINHVSPLHYLDSFAHSLKYK